MRLRQHEQRRTSGAAALPWHALLDDAGLGEPVHQGLDRAAVEPELSRERGPGARTVDVQPA
jgi:hypothetical protein